MRIRPIRRFTLACCASFAAGTISISVLAQPAPQQLDTGKNTACAQNVSGTGACPGGLLKPAPIQRQTLPSAPCKECVICRGNSLTSEGKLACAQCLIDNEKKGCIAKP